MKTRKFINTLDCFLFKQAKYTLTSYHCIRQMEEDVGIFDPEGLLAYAAYFRDALVAGARIVDKDGEALNENSDSAILTLQYKIGNHTLEGQLEVWCSRLRI